MICYMQICFSLIVHCFVLFCLGNDENLCPYAHWQIAKFLHS